MAILTISDNATRSIGKNNNKISTRESGSKITENFLHLKSSVWGVGLVSAIIPYLPIEEEQNSQQLV
jgi:hypothetical protein